MNATVDESINKTLASIEFKIDAMLSTMQDLSVRHKKLENRISDTNSRFGAHQPH